MRTHRKDAGFSLAALIFFATAASILMAAAIPVYRMQAKREMEEELIFRGEEYMRAIRKYHTKFGAYPTSVDQLISTNSLRFLRKPYKDPMTDKEFRLITMNPDGSLTGSKMFTQNMNTQPLFANPQTAGQGFQLRVGQQALQTGQQLQGQGQQQGARGFQSAGQQLQQGQQQFQFQGQQGQQGQQGTRGQQLQQAQQRGQQFGGVMSGINSSVGTPVAFAGIIGVASDSELESIKVYNTRQKYDEWEFIAVMNQQAAQGQQPNQQQPNQNPNQQQQPFGAQRMPFGSQPNSPFQNTPTNPVGGPPQASPFGPAGGQRQNQNPFGFGGTPQQQPPPRGR